MKKILLFSLLSIFFITAFSDDAYAQRRGKKKKSSKTDEYFDESGFANKLWYGGSIPFQITQDQFGNNGLRIGLSPMVGYRFNEIFSVGPRVSFIYNELYLQGDNPKIMELGFGAFGRAKFAASLFAQVEYETRTLSELSDFNLPVGGSDDNFFLGLGYNSSMGSLWGYEILALYNFMEEDESVVPIEFRAGLTYKF